MKIHRFIGTFKLETGRLTIADEPVVHQIRDVLKLHPGEKIQLCDGKKTEALADIVSVAGAGIAVEIGGVSPNTKEPGLKVVLYCAILKSDNFELAVQKATEAGVSEIIPLVTGRTVKEGLRYDRVRRILKEAAEQSGRGIVPELSEAMAFSDALMRAKSAHDANIFFDAAGTAWEDARLKPKTSVGIFIGPEGGWEAEEIESAKKAGLTPVSMGALTLRAETAAVIGTYLATRL